MSVSVWSTGVMSLSTGMVFDDVPGRSRGSSGIHSPFTEALSTDCATQSPARISVPKQSSSERRIDTHRDVVRLRPADDGQAGRVKNVCG